MNNTWYNITKAEDSTSAEVSIYDAIGGWEINAKQFCEELNEIKVDTIHLRINSPGGSVIDGNAIFNSLQRHDAKVITHIDGLAASMASVVAMAGDEIHMADNALMMIHNPWTITMGDADELRKDADLLDKMTASITKAYSRGQYEAEEIKDLMDAETWFTAQEAMDAGMIDHIETGLKAAACDITALATNAELTVPADKQLASMANQIEAITKTNKSLSDELSEAIVNAEATLTELSEARAELAIANESVKEAEAETTKANEALAVKSTELEAKDEEIVAAKVITDEAVSAKAAELVNQNTHEPIHDNGDGLDADTDEQLIAKYEAISDKDDRRDFFAANKTKILRAKARLTTTK